MAKIILVTGGARSGKSSFAEKLAENTVGRIAYIATAEVRDAEMAERVNLHQKRRSERWITIEAPFQAESAFAKIPPKCNTVVFDCLTVYLSNLLLQRIEEAASEDRENRKNDILAAMDRLLDAVRSFPGTVIFVTNEVGDGIVPDNPLAREFRDLAGIVNQKIAADADEVNLVVCGIPLRIKPGSA
jgi:adenosylcobinamide kinase/adenosylcobinamide-phosphate guanylyltransferase